MNATAKDAATAHAEIERIARTVASSEVRQIERIDIGQCVRQGDIYLHAVASSHPCGQPLTSRQLAMGTTRGSRHVAEAPAIVLSGTTPPAWCDPRTLLGPLVRSAARFTVTHPEHAHISLPPGEYQTTHQMDARTLERVVD